MFVLDSIETGTTRSAMTIGHSKHPVASSRLRELASQLLDCSTLCAIATVCVEGSAHISTAYFAWSPELDLIWLSDPRAKHSRNLGPGGTAAVAVYDSGQSWGKEDRGIQLFGSASEAGARAAEAETVYASRFPDYHPGDLSAYRLYVFRPSRVKLFDERELGPGHFVIASVDDKGRPSWEATEIYRSQS
jgi:hypothetical protein